MAESPPPMTAMSLPPKKKPSQVAQELTPWADQCFFGWADPATAQRRRWR